MKQIKQFVIHERSKTQQKKKRMHFWNYFALEDAGAELRFLGRRHFELCKFDIS